MTTRWFAHGFALAAAIIAVAWSVSAGPYLWRAKPVWTFSNRVLEGNSFPIPSLQRAKRFADAIGEIYPCHADTIEAQAVLDTRLAEEALGSGRVLAYDGLRAEAETQARRVLSCAPTRAYFWLLLFWFDNSAKGLDPATLPLLEMSYRRAPYEAWIAHKRSWLAVPLWDQLPPDFQRRVELEFVELIDNSFFTDAFLIYMRGTLAFREKVKPLIARLPITQQAQFVRAAYRFNYLIDGLKVPPPERRPWN